MNREPFILKYFETKKDGVEYYTANETIMNQLINDCPTKDIFQSVKGVIVMHTIAKFLKNTIENKGNISKAKITVAKALMCLDEFQNACSTDLVKLTGLSRTELMKISGIKKIKMSTYKEKILKLFDTDPLLVKTNSTEILNKIKNVYFGRDFSCSLEFIKKVVDKYEHQQKYEMIESLKNKYIDLDLLIGKRVKLVTDSFDVELHMQMEGKLLEADRNQSEVADYMVSNKNMCCYFCHYQVVDCYMFFRSKKVMYEIYIDFSI